LGRPYQHPPQFRALIEEALQLRRPHPTWGAGLVRVLLHRQYPVDPSRLNARCSDGSGVSPVPC